MASVIGSSIVDDGLVFHYDMNNTEKSWKGAPTTNVVSHSLPISGWSVSNSSGSSATLTYELEDNIPHLKITNVTLGSGSTDYPRIVASNFSQNITDGFSVSFEAKGTPGETIKLAIYSAGSTKSTNTAILTDKWTRYTFNNISTGFTLDQPYIRFDSNFGASSVRYIRRIQIEQRQFASPYVDGIRTNTQSILDLTNQNTITANNLTYNSDNSFNFNASSSEIDTGPSSNYFPIGDVSHNLSVEMVVYPVEYSKMLFGQFIDLNRLYIGIYTNSFKFGWGSNPWSGTFLGVDKPVQLNKYYHVVLSIINGTARMYVNGEETVSFSDTGVTLPSKLNFGAYYENGFMNNSYMSNCKIPVGKLYSRGLSGAEVKQNFESYRRRYGI